MPGFYHTEVEIRSSDWYHTLIMVHTAGCCRVSGRIQCAVGIAEEYRNKGAMPRIRRPGDTMETVHFDYFASSTRLVTEALRTLAKRKEAS